MALQPRHVAHVIRPMSNEPQPMREKIQFSNGNGIYRARTHAATLFHALRVIRGHFFWGAYAHGVFCALNGQPKTDNPHFHPRFPHHVTVSDWDRGYDHGRRRIAVAT